MVWGRYINLQHSKRIVFSSVLLFSNCGPFPGHDSLSLVFSKLHPAFHSHPDFGGALHCTPHRAFPPSALFMAKSQAISSVLLAYNHFESVHCSATPWFCCCHSISLDVQQRIDNERWLKWFLPLTGLFCESQRYKTKRLMWQKNDGFEVLLLFSYWATSLAGCSKSTGLKYFPITTDITYFLLDSLYPLFPMLTINLPLFSVIQIYANGKNYIITSITLN